MAETPLVYLNGRFLPEDRAHVSVQDRGFLYGDGLFEAVRVYDGAPFLWLEHMKRFGIGCSTLRIVPPLSGGELNRVCGELIRRNGLKDCFLRLSLSRGVGPRGYSPKGSEHPTLLVSTFPAPASLPSAYRVILSSLQLPARDPLAHFKHSNKLRQIMARAEADEAGADEALLLDTRGCVVEGTTTNLFWVQGKTIYTPPSGGILEGCARTHVIRLCEKMGLPLKEQDIRPTRLLHADGIFLTSSGVEVMEVSHVDGKPVKRSRTARQLQRHFRTAHRDDAPNRRRRK
jgi:aminodeoxychorismate lyase